MYEVWDTTRWMQAARATADGLHRDFHTGPCYACDLRTLTVMKINRLEVLWDVQRTVALLGRQ